MKYLDITTEAKISALAILETESERSTPKKWKTNANTLHDFLGLRKQMKSKLFVQNLIDAFCGGQRPLVR